MTKKKSKKQKHQSEASVVAVDTSDEELNDSSHSGKCCPHILRAVNFGRVRKTLRSNQANILICNDCSKSQAEEDEASEVWICLQCGYRGCGRASTNKHAVQHFKTIHSDCHSLVLSSQSGAVWCYDCDDEARVQSNNLKQCIEFIMRLKGVVPKNSTSVPDSKDVKKKSLIESVIEDQARVTEPAKNNLKSDNSKNKSKNVVTIKNPIKGLKNLGNTCFFNSIMQNLCQTELFVEEIKNTEWEIPKLIVVNKCVIEDSSAERIKVTLPKQRLLVNALMNFFRDMSLSNSAKVEIVNPSALFSEVSKMSPQFGRFLQQDSHELLRQLLDGIRQDEVKRQEHAILRHLNLVGADRKELSDDLKKMLKIYGMCASNTVVERIFGGHLISTVTCDECQKSSQVFEPFMDISLPLFEEKPIRNSKVESNDEENDGYVLKRSTKDDSKISKHQEKKMKKLAKRETKKNRQMGRGKQIDLKEQFDNRDSDATNAPDVPADNLEIMELNSSEHLNGGVEDSSSHQTPDLQPAGIVVQPVNHVQNSDSHVNDYSSAMDNTIEHTDDVTHSELLMELPMKNKDILKPDKLCMELQDPILENCSPGDLGASVDISEMKEEYNSETSDTSIGASKRILTTPVDENNISTSNDGMLNLTEDFRKFWEECQLIKNDTSENYTSKDNILDSTDSLSNMNIESQSNLTQFVSLWNQQEEHSSSLEGSESNNDEDLVPQSIAVIQTQALSKCLTTLGSRSPVTSLECSIDSCLLHFTKPELLTGSNKFRCENCTDIKRQKSGNKKDVAYTNAKKQILIFSPPAILTLHLKRFQQVGSGLRKVNRYVEFPLLLDLAPYCSSACLMLRHMSSVQDKVLYSLYGLIEHSGRLTSGHYTAYVKVRRRTLNRAFVNTLPHGKWDLTRLMQKISDLDVSGRVTGDNEESQDSESGRWFYISDSHVSTATEAQVLKCQAYLLFYERIK